MISVSSVSGLQGAVVVLLFEEIPLSVSGSYIVFLVLVVEAFKFSTLVKTD